MGISVTPRSVMDQHFANEQDIDELSISKIINAKSMPDINTNNKLQGV